jgi:hypothetical protein
VFLEGRYRRVEVFSQKIKTRPIDPLKIFSYLKEWTKELSRNFSHLKNQRIN